MNKKLKTVTNRAYGSWLLYMGLFALPIIFKNRYWYLFLGLMVLTTAVVFMKKEQILLEIGEDHAVFYPDGKSLLIPHDKLESFEYLNQNTNELKVVYRDDEDQIRSFILSDTNIPAVHAALNRYLPDKNRVKAAYEEEVEKNRQANRKYLEKQKDKVRQFLGLKNNRRKP